MAPLSPRLVVTIGLTVFWLAAVGLTTAQYSEEGSLLCLANYAKFNTNHTACLKPNGCRITHWGVSKAEQKQIVDIHNYYRNQIASGNETRLGFPSAANMLKMEWDPELAYIAQMHANQCKFAHDCYDCRRTDRHEFVGQNLYVYQTTRTSIGTQWPFVIKEWYDEIQIAPPIVAQSFDLFNLNIGHFTQIAWATTNRVGCGYVTYDVSGQEGENSIFKTAQLYTCNYAPGGNFLGEKMYEDGTAASQCPARYRRSKRFTSLCEFARKSNKNKPRKPNNTNKKVIKTVTQLTSTVPLHPVDPSLAPAQLVPITTNAINLPETSAPQTTSLVTQPQTSLFTAPETTSTTRRLITTTITSPIWSTTTTTSTNKPVFTLKPFTRNPSSVSRTSKRVTNWWDQWSRNFGNSLSSSNNRPQSSTTRAPWKNWSSFSNKPTRSNANTNTGRIFRFEMSHNGTTTLNQLF